MIYLFNDDKRLQGIVEKEFIRTIRFEREKNSLYEVIVEIPVVGHRRGEEINLHNKVKDAVFLGHYDLEGRFQLHKVALYDVDSGMIRIQAVHIFFDEAKAGAIIRERRYIDKEISDGARDAFAEIGWQMADFDISPPRTYNFYNVSPLEARAILIEKFGYEFDFWLDFDGKKISGKYFSVKRRIGGDSNKRYVFNKKTNVGSHVISLRAEQDYSEVYTAVIGRGRGEEYEDTGGYGRRIEYTDIEWKKPNDPLDKPLGSRILHDPEATQAFGYVEGDAVKPRTAVVIFSDIEEQEELIEASYDWLVEHRRPKLLFDVNVADGDGLNLGDTVHIKYEDIGLNIEVRVGKVTEDLKSGERHVELGDVAYFNPGRSNREIKRSIAQSRRDASNKIFQLKQEFDENFNNTVQQIRDDFEQVLIDVHAEIEASEQRHDDKWEHYEAEIDDTIESIVGGSLESLDTNLLDINSRLLSKLDESDLQPLHGRIDNAFSDIGEVTGNLNTTRSELQGQLDDAFSDISEVSGDLSTARSELQEQLDEARADLENMEIGGGNLVPDSNNFNSSVWRVFNGSVIETEPDDAGYEKVHMYSGGSFIKAMYMVDYLRREFGDEEVTLSFDIINDGSQINIGHNWLGGRIDNGAIPEGFSGRYVYTGIISSSAAGQIQFRATSSDEELNFRIRRLQIQLGNTPTKWQPSYKDTEEKITTLSESIEYIDGQLEAKLNRTEIEPIQNKITEYGTTLDANAESISLLQDKTQLHDDDIEYWSNQAESTAEEVSRILTHNSEQDGLITSVTNESRETAEGLERTISRVSETESDISSAQANIIANADLIGATMTRVDENDQAIGDFQATADGLKADFTRYQSDFGDDMEAIQTQVASYEANVDGFRAEVGVLSKDVSSVQSWQSEKGAVIDGNADAIRTRIWKQDIDDIEVGGKNLILDSHNVIITSGDGSSGNLSFVNSENLIKVTAINNKGRQNFYNTGFANYWVNKDEIFKNIQKGEEYTLSMEVRYSGDSRVRYAFDTRGVNSAEYAYTDYITDTNGEWVKVVATKKESGRSLNNQSLLIGWFDEIKVGDYTEIRNIKLEKGNKATDWTPAPEDTEAKITQLNTDITVEAGRINTLLTRTSSVEKSIADINTSVDGITADFANYKQDIDSDVGALSTQVASYEASVDGFRAEVGTLQGDINDVDSWIADKGAVIDGTAEAISARVWQQDITNAVDGIELGARNMLLDTAGETTIDESYKRWWLADNALYGHVGNSVTLSFEAKADTAGEIIRPYFTGDGINTIDNMELTTEWKKYSVTFTLDSESYETVSFHTNGYGGATVFTGHVRRVKLEKGNKATDHTLAPEDTLMKTDFILESDGFFLGGKYVGGDHYSTAIVGSSDGIDILASRMRVTGDLLVKGDVETYALDAVHGDITNLRSKLLTSNVVQSDHISVGSALANKFNANSAFISRLEVQAANIRDLTGIHIRGGMLESLNGRTRFNLDTGLLQMDNTDFRLGGNAHIRFTNRNNRLLYINNSVYAGIQFDHTLGTSNPYIGIGVSDFAHDVNDSTFRGIRIHSLGAEGRGFGVNAVTHNFRMNQNPGLDGRGLSFVLNATGSNVPGIYPQYTGNYNYYLGSHANKWQRVYTQAIHTSGPLQIRNDDTSVGWNLNTIADSGSITLVFGGINTHEWNYHLGSSYNPFNRLYIKNSPNVTSDGRLKKDIRDNELGLDFINEVKTKRYRMNFGPIEKNDDKFKLGIIAQDVKGLLERQGFGEDFDMVRIGDTGYYSFAYEQLIAPTIKALQEVDAKVETNAEKIKRLEKEIELLKGE